MLHRTSDKLLYKNIGVILNANKNEIVRLFVCHDITIGRKIMYGLQE